MNRTQGSNTRFSRVAITQKPSSMCSANPNSMYQPSKGLQASSLESSFNHLTDCPFDLISSANALVTHVIGCGNLLIEPEIRHPCTCLDLRPTRVASRGAYLHRPHPRHTPARTLACGCEITSSWNLSRADCHLPNLRARHWDAPSVCRSEDIFVYLASSPSESIFVPMMPSLSNCAISASESPRRPDRISLLCCPSVGATVRTA